MGDGGGGTDNTNASIKLTVNLNSQRDQYSPETSVEDQDQVRADIVITLTVFKNKLKLDKLLELNKNGKIISAAYVEDSLKMKIKAKPSGITENNQLINSNAQAETSISINKINEIKEIRILFKKIILNNKNIPIFFFLKHFSISINKYIERNNCVRKEKWNFFLRSNQTNLSSTFLSILTRDDKGKNIFSILHLNHFTGYISNHMNIKLYYNTPEATKPSKIDGYKLNENLKLCHFILFEIKELHAKNNDMVSNSNINLIQLSLNFLGSTNTINNIRKNKLLKILNRIKSKFLFEFEIIDITKYRKQECLQLFHIVYNNNPNIKLEELIKNYNALIEKRKKTIENRNYYFNESHC